MCVYIYIYMYVCVCIYMCVCIYIYMCVCVCIFIYMCVCIRGEFNRFPDIFVVFPVKIFRNSFVGHEFFFNAVLWNLYQKGAL